MNFKRSFVIHVFRLIILNVFFIGGFLSADTLPNLCSKDQNPNQFTIFSYHEISDKSETLEASYAVSPSNFEQQMLWLIENGYHFIKIDDILEYKNKNKPLPKKAVLITFDDGYSSVYRNAFPILKKYKIPTVIALVGSWMMEDQKVNFGGKIVDRSSFLSKEQLKEMIDSGLVEIGSHSFDMHKGIIGNPQGNMQPAMRTRQWFSDTKKYEDEKSYQKRIYDDLMKNNQFIKDYTGQKSRVIVWPYGHYNIETRMIAEKLGMNVGLTLDDGSNTSATPLWGLRRILVEHTMTIKDLERNMGTRNSNITDEGRTTKAAHVDLDYIYDPDPEMQNLNLGDLLERLNSLGVNTVYLQAFSDHDANGSADHVYFPNRHIPMLADLFNRVSWQIVTRTKVTRVYAWMPLMAWELPKNNPVSKDVVKTLQVDPSHLNMGYHRLSPFSKNAKKVIREIYEDLAKSSYIDGILFHDDVTLSDFEDDSKFARVQYKKWGLSGSVSKIRANKNEFQKWTRLKTNYLDDFAMELSEILRNEQPGLKTARNMYAQVALNDGAEEWYAQNLSDSIKKYDYTAIMAMPYMEQAENHKKFYEDIVSNIKNKECGLEKTVMELQTVNWRKNDEPISTDEITDTIKFLYSNGVEHIAYYPDNILEKHPNTDKMKQTFIQKLPYMNSLPKTAPLK